jgi:large subunit ribosomal protein L13
MQKTLSATPKDIQRRWYVVDVQDVVLGRAASQIAAILRGKHKPYFTPHADTGDYVIVINAEKVRLTGNKWNDKMYHHHSGYIGGIHSANAKTIVQRHPTQLVEDAVRRMIRRSPLGRDIMSKLKVIAGPDYSKHAAQKPELLKLAY